MLYAFHVRYSDRSYKLDVWANENRWLYAVLRGALMGVVIGVMTAVIWSDAIRGLINGGVWFAGSILLYGYLGWDRKERKHRIEKRRAEATPDAS